MGKNFLDHLFCVVLLLMFGSATAFAAVSPTPDALYAEGKYAEAVQAYLEIEKSKGSSASLYYNLANSYAQMGDYGDAVLYYKRAYRLDPRNIKISNNLDFISSKVEDSNRAELKGKKISVTADHETFFQTANRLISLDVLSDSWALLSAVAFVMFLGCVAVYLFCTNVLLRKTGFFGGIVLFVLSVIFIIFAFMAASSQTSEDQCVLMKYRTELLVEPSSDAKPASSQLCQGTVFEILGEETDVQGSATWYKVRLNSNFEGWVRASDVEII